MVARPTRKWVIPEAPGAMDGFILRAAVPFIHGKEFNMKQDTSGISAYRDGAAGLCPAEWCSSEA